MKTRLLLTTWLTCCWIIGSCGTTSIVEDRHLTRKELDRKVEQKQRDEDDGYAVFATIEAEKQNRLSASHIFVSYTTETKKKKKGRRRRIKEERTKDEAASRIREAYQKLNQGVPFGEVVQMYSECPSKAKDGDLGIFDASRMAPEFVETAFSLAVGEISEPVETKQGFHIIKRQVVEEVRARHILVMHDGSKQKPTTLSRTRAEAATAIQEIASQLASDGSNFKAIAKNRSDCPSGHRGGDLGTFGRGQMSLPFENAVFSLEENEISAIVETEFGFHIIQRLPLYEARR